jgi:hypothetical protein
MVRCGRRYHPRGAGGLPLRIKKTSDMDDQSDRTNDQSQQFGEKEISGAVIGCGRSAMKSLK